VGAMSVAMKLYRQRLIATHVAPTGKDGGRACMAGIYGVTARQLEAS
jgi:hypothetical protein